MKTPVARVPREKKPVRGASCPVLAIIPSRYASSRLPGKPLLDIGGWPMIRHVYARALTSGVDRVVVATDDRQIAETVEIFGGEVVMTSPHCPSGTDRIAEAMETLGLGEDAIVVNVQGDEPFVDPADIDRVAGALQDHAECAMATLGVPFADESEWRAPDVVKVVCDRNQLALYFSRALIPYWRDRQGGYPTSAVLRHVGLYAYRASFLRQFAQLPVTPLEQLERLEQLRAIEYGHKIYVVTGAGGGMGIDTPEDLARARLRCGSMEGR
jgi:3-deoxy-manno-octulosonate cytidylyltransferase (CMP-KDO synthetase)